MINNTFLSLNVFSLICTSPFYSIYDTNKGLLRSAFYNSRFSHSLTNIIFSNTNQHQTVISKSRFSHIMNSAIFLVSDVNSDCKFVYSDGSKFQVGSIIKNETVKPDKYTDDEGENYRPFFRKDNGNSICGDITITECIFDGCFAKTYSGGSIHIEQQCSVMIHSTIFNNSYTGRRFGGAGVICQKITNEDSDFETEKLRRLDIRYCCFQDCYGKGENTNECLFKLYGVALFIASENAILYYASTVNCPGIEINDERKQACGAQFDMNAKNVTSHFVNATGGYSEYCGGIEYRSATEGFFRYQTISKMKCMFAIAYTDIGEATLDLSYSNVFDIELIRSDSEKNTKVHPGLIHIRRTKDNYGDYLFVIRNFCFINNNFNNDNNARIVSRGTNFNNYQPITIKLISCSYDCGDNMAAITEEGMDNKLATELCNINQNPTTNEVEQLSLGDCQGKVSPGPLTDILLTTQFSESAYFSFSYQFTQSADFSKTNMFSSSSLFTKSGDFTKTGAFSKTTGFTESSDFSQSDNFEPSEKFTKSSVFSNSANFAPSEKFSQSCDFTKSTDFIATSKFSKSKDFSNSADFSLTQAFSSSKDFSQSVDFSQSDAFHPSEPFTKTNTFTSSNSFSSSDSFTPSSRFTQSNSFSESEQFSGSETNLIPFLPGGGEERSGNKNNKGMIAGIAVAAAVVVAIIVVAAIFLIKKKSVHISEENVESLDGNTNSINNVNPIYDNEGADDPFNEDFK